MPETVLEASWRLGRQVKIIYNDRARMGLQATGHITELKPGAVKFVAIGGFEFDLDMQDILLIDGRNPFVADSSTSPEPASERIVFYVSGQPPRPNEQLNAFGKVFELPGGAIMVETPDGREITIPRSQVIRIENPNQTNPYPAGKRLAGLR